MRKMFYRVALVLLTALTVCACFASPVGAEEAETSETVTAEGETSAPVKSEWELFLEEKLVPGIIVVVTAIGTIYLAISPILFRVRSASDKFSSATDTATKAAEQALTSSKKYEASEHSIRTNTEMIAGFEKRLQSIESGQRQVEKMIRTGFCNMDEIVKKGYASEIAKLGNANEKTDETEN